MIEVSHSGSIQDVVPTRDFRMIEYMEMLAVFESSRSMLPEKFQDLDQQTIQEQLDIMFEVGRAPVKQSVHMTG